MKQGPLQVEVKPRTTGQTVAVAARMLQHRPGSLLLAWLLASLPTGALASWLLLGAGVGPWWTWAVILPIASLFTLPVTTTVGLLVFSPAVRLGDVLRQSLSRTLPYATLFIVTRLLALVGLVALLVPGLYLWRYSWFLGPIVVLERATLSASLRRSRRFAIGFHGHVLAHAANTAGLLIYASVALGTSLHFIIATVLGSNIEAIGALTGYDHYKHLLGLLGFSLAVPLATIVWFFVYLDVRIRKEGWDLEIAFRERAVELERRHAA